MGGCRSPLPPLPTMIVGSLPQPDWLIDRDRLGHQFPPRVRATELWRIPPELLPEAQDDATLAAIRAQEEAGLDVVTDGEIRRESYSNHFATALDGLDLEHPGTVRNRSGMDIPVPRVTGELRRPGPVQADDVRFLRGAHRPGDQDHGARAVHDGPAGAERPLRRRPRAWPWRTPTSSGRRSPTCSPRAPTSSRSTSRGCRPGPEVARQYGAEAVTRAVGGAAGPVHVHLCFGYAAMVADRPEGYSFLPELADIPADTISVETAQSRLDPATLRPLRDKGIALGRPRPLDTGGRDAGDDRRPGAPGAGPRRRATGSCSPATAASSTSPRVGGREDARPRRGRSRAPGRTARRAAGASVTRR